MNFIFRTITVLVCLLLGSIVSLFAQDDKVNIENKDHDIEAITVSTNVSQPSIKQGAVVQTMRSEKIEALGMDGLHDVVRSFAGVNITDYGGLGGVKTVSVRSLGAHHTAVSYDGVVISNAQGGQVDIGSFSLENIEEVSLTIGQGDEIFQGARNFESSGVLKLKSAAPNFVDQKIKVGLQAEAGSFGYYNPALDLAAKISDEWSMRVVSDWMKTDGDYPFTLVNGQIVTEEIRNNSDVERLRAELNVYGTVGSKGGKLNIKGSYLDSERGLPGSVIYYNTRANERLWDKSRFVQASYSVDLSSKWSVQSSAKYDYAWTKYADWDTRYQDNYLENRYTQQEYYLSGTLLFKPSKRWSFSFAQDVFENILVTTLNDCPDPYRLSLYSAFAAQYRTERLTATASLLGVHINEWALNDTYEIAPDREHLSPSASLSYQILADHDLRMRLSVKDAYRLPTFTDLYYSTMGNTDLKAERAMQYNIGVTYGGNPLPSIMDYATISVDAYYNEVHDKIVAIPTMFLWRMINLGEVEIKGLDVNLSTYFTLFDSVKLNVSGNYTYQDAVDVTDPADKNYGDQIPYTALHSGNMALTLQHKWFDLGYRATMVGNRYSLPQNIDVNLIEGYIDQNINISRSFDFAHFSMRLRAEVLNLCDVNYDVIKNYPMPGRQYRFSVKFTY